jgi:aryl-alcohol dehydrogenase-like predicted oxidoreductase
MRYTNLPQSNLQISVIAMGCWALAGDTQWGPQSENDSIDAVRAALDAGINCFDTAPGYGDGLSEERLGKGLSGLRDKAVVATKIGPDAMRADAVVASLEKSLRRLRMDYVDLIQIHWPSREVPIEETWGALERLRQQGKVRAIAVSNFGHGDLADLLRVGVPIMNQLPYSLLTRAIEYEIIPACERAGVGVLCYSPLAWGLLADKYASPDEVPSGRARSRHFSKQRSLTRHGEAGCEAQTFDALGKIRDVARRLDVSMSELAVAWLLHKPSVASVLTGIRVPAQAADNARAARIELDSEALAQLDRATEPVKKALGANADLWQSSDNSRFR